MTINQIIQGCKAKERMHQQALYQLVAEDLMRVATRYIKDTNAAKDVFQDSFLLIFKKIHQFDPERGSIGAWTARIVTNLAIEHLRKNKTFTRVEDLPIAMHPIESDSIEDTMAADEMLAIIYELPDSYRVIFLLYVVEGYSHKEIAKRLGITSSTSRSQLVRAKAKLRSLLQKKTKLKLSSYVTAK